jgi:hypothetical protein
MELYVVYQVQSGDHNIYVTKGVVLGFRAPKNEEELYIIKEDIRKYHVRYFEKSDTVVIINWQVLNNGS